MITIFRNKLHRYKMIYLRYGWWMFLREIALCIIRKIFTFNITYIYKLDKATIKSANLLSCDKKIEIKFKFASPKKIDPDLLKAADIDLSWFKIPNKRIFIGLHKEKVIFISIVSLKHFKIRNIRIILPPDCAYIQNCYVVPELRGKCIYPCGLKILANLLFNESINYLYLSVQFENEASLRGIKKVGFYSIARIITIGFRKKIIENLWKWLNPLNNFERKTWKIELEE